MDALPAVVFQHFRNPQHRGVLEAPDAVGKVEARREDAWVFLYLRVGPDTRVEASFDLQGDRSATAALSLLTSLIQGRPLAEVEALTLEQVADAHGLSDTQLPMLVPAHDALVAALADLRGEPPPFADDGEVVCTCLHVRQGSIERTIRQRNLTSVDEVRFWTRACTGCRTCRPDVERLLAARER